MPKRASSSRVIAIKGLEINSPKTSITMLCLPAASGNAISEAVKNWLETSPRTRIGSANARGGPPGATAGTSGAGARAGGGAGRGGGGGTCGMCDAQRRVAVVAEVVDPATELAQRIDQITDRALVHARHARELELAAEQGQRCRQRAHRGAGIAQKEFGRRARGAAAQARDVHAAARFIDGAADLAQCVEHHAGVVGRQQLMHGG